MPTLNEELDICNFEELGDKFDPLGRNIGNYRPSRDLRLYPGANLSAERRAQLDAQAVEPEDLTIDDIVYSLSMVAATTLYGMIQQIEERWGKEAARDAVYDWARRRGRDNITKYMTARGETHITPELWARFQDFRHLVSGPIHAHTFMTLIESDESEDVIELNRTACLFNTGRPAGMASYSGVVSEGKELGYRQAYPEISFDFAYCMAEGTSRTGCKARMVIKKAESAELVAEPA